MVEPRSMRQCGTTSGKQLWIMAMPWVENATSADEMIDNLAACFGFSEYWIKHQLSVDRASKPNGRVVYTIPIHGDFYLDINVIQNKL